MNLVPTRGKGGGLKSQYLAEVIYGRALKGGCRQERGGLGFAYIIQARSLAAQASSPPAAAAAAAGRAAAGVAPGGVGFPVLDGAGVEEVGVEGVGARDGASIHG